MKTRALQITVGLVLAAIIVLAAACQKRGPWDDTVITSPGQYLLTGSKKLLVKTTEDDFVSFVLQDNGTDVIHHQERDSAFSMFRLMWDSERQRLWYNSSDTGSLVYVPETTSTYTAYHIVPRVYPDYDKPQLLIRDVPPEIRQQLDLADK